MAVESAIYIGQLDQSYPPASDPLTETDDHLRLIKTVLKTQFPSLGNTAITVTAAAINNILNLAPIASPTLTGTPRAPTPSPSAAGTEIATMAAVASAIAAAVLAPGTLPPVAGLADKFLFTDGTSTGWDYPGSRGYAHFRDEKASGTNGGASSATTTHTRTLNTTVRNTLTGASLGSNEVTLPAGTYRVRAIAPAAGNVGQHKAHIYNVTDGAVLLVGVPMRSGAATESSASVVDGSFTLAAQKNISLRHYVTSSVAGNGLGSACNDGNIEVYASLQIWRIG